MKFNKVVVFGLLISLLTGCASSYSNAASANISKPPTPSLSLSEPKITEQNGTITISVLLSNTTNKAISVQSSQFALMNGDITLSPSKDSQIPNQIPANSKVKILLNFSLSNQISGSVSFKLAFQPAQNTPEEFITLDAITIQKTQPTDVKNTQPISATPTPALITFNDSQNGIVVDVPKDWVKAPLQGGDWGGWKFINPNDPNEEEILVNSGNISAYMNSKGQPDPTAAIPEQNVSSEFVFNNGLSAGYTFYKAGNPYTGYGVVTVSTNENGYGFVEIIVPENIKPLATQILNSFRLTL